MLSTNFSIRVGAKKLGVRDISHQEIKANTVIEAVLCRFFVFGLTSVL